MKRESIGLDALDAYEARLIAIGPQAPDLNPADMDPAQREKALAALQHQERVYTAMLAANKAAIAWCEAHGMPESDGRTMIDWIAAQPNSAALRADFERTVCEAERAAWKKWKP
jgi:hypothetical protein